MHCCFPVIGLANFVKIPILALNQMYQLHGFKLFWTHRSIFLISSPYAWRGRTVLQFPTNSYHLSTVELALKGVLCTRLSSKAMGDKRRLQTCRLARLAGKQRKPCLSHLKV